MAWVTLVFIKYVSLSSPDLVTSLTTDAPRHKTFTYYQIGFEYFNLVNETTSIFRPIFVPRMT